MHSRDTVSPPKSVSPHPQSDKVADRCGQECPRAWGIHGFVVLALLGVCVALYGRTFGLDFLTLDDPDYVQSNPFIANLDRAKVWHIISTPYFANYAPGHLLSYALDVAVAGGKSARAMHASNVGWYGWVVCMVYVLGLAVYRSAERQAGSGPLPKGQPAAGCRYTPNIMAAAAALLFAAHPAHVEVVAWLSSRKDLVATGFATLSMACYLRSRGGSTGAKWWYAASVASFLLASSGKQSVLLLPIVMLAWDVLVDKRRGWGMLAEKIPFALIALIFGWMTWGAQPSTRQSPDAFVLAMTQWSNLWLLTGFGQYVLYRPKPNPAEVDALLRVAAIAGAVLVWSAPLLLAHWRQLIRASLCCWVLMQMLPPMALSFLTPITDRYLFLPSAGVCLLLVNLKPRNVLSTQKWTAMSGWVALALVLGVWSWKTWAYVGEWGDPRSVW